MSLNIFYFLHLPQKKPKLQKNPKRQLKKSRKKKEGNSTFEYEFFLKAVLRMVPLFGMEKCNLRKIEF